MNLPKSSIDAVILGSGAWGRALAFTLSRNDKKVLIQFRNKKPGKKEFDLPNIEFINDISEITSLSKPIIIFKVGFFASQYLLALVTKFKNT